MNWGLANPIRAEIIPPEYDRWYRIEKGYQLPARPCHLCITAPEYSVTATVSGRDTVEPTVEELDAMEARQAEKEAAREALEVKRNLEDMDRAKKRKEQESAEKKAREERAAANKKAGFPRKKKEDKVIYIPLGRAHKKDWA